MKREIYKMEYDNHLNKDGSEKENRFIGEFKVLQQLHGSENDYDEQFIGVNVADGKTYLVSGIEVSGFNGGKRFEAVRLPLEPD
mgnify:CR=1 FL=1